MEGCPQGTGTALLGLMLSDADERRGAPSRVVRYSRRCQSLPGESGVAQRARVWIVGPYAPFHHGKTDLHPVSGQGARRAVGRGPDRSGELESPLLIRTFDGEIDFVREQSHCEPARHFARSDRSPTAPSCEQQTTKEPRPSFRSHPQNYRLRNIRDASLVSVRAGRTLLSGPGTE